jgi:hypothetical protein
MKASLQFLSAPLITVSYTTCGKTSAKQAGSLSALSLKLCWHSFGTLYCKQRLCYKTTNMKILISCESRSWRSNLPYSDRRAIPYYSYQTTSLKRSVLRMTEQYGSLQHAMEVMPNNWRGPFSLTSITTRKEQDHRSFSMGWLLLLRTVIRTSFTCKIMPTGDKDQYW